MDSIRKAGPLNEPTPMKIETNQVVKKGESVTLKNKIDQLLDNISNVTQPAKEVKMKAEKPPELLDELSQLEQDLDNIIKDLQVENHSKTSLTETFQDFEADLHKAVEGDSESIEACKNKLDQWVAPDKLGDKKGSTSTKRQSLDATFGDLEQLLMSETQPKEKNDAKMAEENPSSTLPNALTNSSKMDALRPKEGTPGPKRKQSEAEKFAELDNLLAPKAKPAKDEIDRLLDTIKTPSSKIDQILSAHERGEEISASLLPNLPTAPTNPSQMNALKPKDSAPAPKRKQSEAEKFAELDKLMAPKAKPLEQKEINNEIDKLLDSLVPSEKKSLKETNIPLRNDPIAMQKFQEQAQAKLAEQISTERNSHLHAIKQPEAPKTMNENNIGGQTEVQAPSKKTLKDKLRSLRDHFIDWRRNTRVSHLFGRIHMSNIQKFEEVENSKPSQNLESLKTQYETLSDRLKNNAVPHMKTAYTRQLNNLKTQIDNLEK